jgi:hypothetical protein
MEREREQQPRERQVSAQLCFCRRSPPSEYQPSLSLRRLTCSYSFPGNSMAPPEKDSWNNVQDTDAKRALADDKFDDCTACRVTGMLPLKTPGFRSNAHCLGSAAFIGLGIYSYRTGMNNLRKQEDAIMRGATKYKMGSRQLGIVTISATLVGMGVWRAFN